MGWQDGTPVDAAQPAWMQGTPVNAEAKSEAIDAPEQRSFMDKLKRQVGLTVRAAGPTGAGAALGAAMGAPLGGVGAILGALAGAGAMTLTQLIDSLAGTNYIGEAMNAMGVPNPENAQERIVGTAAAGMAGVPGTVGIGQTLQAAASPVKQSIGALLQSSQGLQTASAATGGLSTGAARENGAGPVGQMAAGLLGASVPSLAAGAPATLRGMLGGGQTTQDRLAVLRDAGIQSPSAGLSTGSRTLQATESGLSRMPGSAGTMINAGERVAADMGAKVDSLANSVKPGAGVVKAGVAIDKGIKSFVDNFRSTQSQLYDALDQYIPPDTQVQATNVLRRLESVTKAIPGAESTSAIIATPKLSSVKGALSTDAAPTPSVPILSKILDANGNPIVTGATLAKPGGIPYEALKELRSAIGAKITNPSLTDDVPTGQWKQIYAALSDDMRAAAKAAGPSATMAFNRANTFTRAGHDRIDTYLSGVAGKDAPEQIFQAAMSGMKDGGSKVQAVMKSIPDDARNTVKASFIKRLGTATPGNQNADGDVFSSQTFLTNWNKVSPQAKSVLFSGQDGRLRENLDQIARAAEMIKQGSKVFGNPSGTAQAISNQTMGLGTVGALLTGHPIVAATGVGAMGTARLSAKLMTSPAFVSWLANATKSPNMTPTVMASQLAQVAKMERDPEKRAEIEALGRQ